MPETILYHGSNQKIEHPLCSFGRDNLDFGKGFYLTDIRTQAEQWAKRIVQASITGEPTINIYRFDRNSYISESRYRIFESYDEDWLKFIVESRLGNAPWSGYDYIEGGVANDRVVDTVNLYIAGLMDLTTALGRLSMHKPNNQICLLNQSLTDKYLTFHAHEIV